MRILWATVGIASVVLALAVQSGCKLPVYDADVQYVERLVINGSLTPGEPISGIYVGKTLPVTTIPDPADAEIHDAAVVIAVDGQEFPLFHTGSGLYGNNAIIAVPGKTYELTVAWNGLRATAQTLVPFSPDTATTTFTRTGNQTGIITSVITPHTGEVYGITFIHAFWTSPGSDRSIWYGPLPGLVRATDTGADGKIHLSTSVYLETTGSPDTLWVTVSALDAQFYTYFYSSGNTSDFENLILGVPPGSPDWNISGDGIGLFVGKASTTKVIPLYLTWAYEE